MKLGASTHTIADATTVVTKGTTPTTLGRQFTSHGVSFVKAECISGDGALLPEKRAYIDEVTDQLLKRSRLQKDDVLFSIAGVIGRTALVATSALPANTNQAIAILRPNPEKIIPRFLYYTVRSKTFQDHSLGHVVQTAQANVSLGVLSAAPIWLPPIATQRRIAGILSAYDELIENNQRRIKILESMVRTLYREWFVQFRFPGHEAVPRVSSPLGEIPQGWEVRKVAEFADFTRGFEPGSAAYKTEAGIGLLTFLRVGDLSKRDSGLFIDEQIVQGRVLKPLDIAITLDGSVGEVRLGLDGAYSSGIRRVDVKDASRIGWVFMYQLLLSDAIQATIQAHAKGTTIKHAGSAVAALEFVSPPAIVIKKFETIAAPMVRMILSLQEQAENLRRTRDLLIPRLISGELDVEASAA